MAEMVKVKALAGFAVGGKISGPGEREVPAEKVEMLVERGLIEAPAGGKNAEARAEAERRGQAIARIAAAASVERTAKEDESSFLERIASAIEGAREASGGNTESEPGDELPEDFPHREAVTKGGFTTKAAARKATDDELLALDGIGEARLKEIRAALGSK